MTSTSKPPLKATRLLDLSPTRGWSTPEFPA